MKMLRPLFGNTLLKVVIGEFTSSPLSIQQNGDEVLNNTCPLIHGSDGRLVMLGCVVSIMNE